jgi:hypothetical protein
MADNLVRSASDLISVAAIVLAFGLTVIIFRVQRELSVREKYPGSPTWIACSDWLILVSVVLVLLFAMIPLLAVAPAIWRVQAAACVAAVILEVGYIPAILAHYRIGIGANRKGPRDRGEPAEVGIVLATLVLAAIGFVFTAYKQVSK